MFNRYRKEHFSEDELVTPPQTGLHGFGAIPDPDEEESEERKAKRKGVLGLLETLYDKPSEDFVSTIFDQDFENSCEIFEELFTYEKPEGEFKELVLNCTASEVAPIKVTKTSVSAIFNNETPQQQARQALEVAFLAANNPALMNGKNGVELYGENPETTFFLYLAAEKLGFADKVRQGGYKPPEMPPEHLEQVKALLDNEFKNMSAIARGYLAAPEEPVADAEPEEHTEEPPMDAEPAPTADDDVRSPVEAEEEPEQAAPAAESEPEPEEEKPAPFLLTDPVVPPTADREANEDVKRKAGHLGRAIAERMESETGKNVTSEADLWRYWSDLDQGTKEELLVKSSANERAAHARVENLLRPKTPKTEAAPKPAPLSLADYAVESPKTLSPEFNEIVKDPRYQMAVDYAAEHGKISRDRLHDYVRSQGERIGSSTTTKIFNAMEENGLLSEPTSKGREYIGPTPESDASAPEPKKAVQHVLKPRAE